MKPEYPRLLLHFTIVSVGIRTPSNISNKVAMRGRHSDLMVVYLDFRPYLSESVRLETSVSCSSGWPLPHSENDFELPTLLLPPPKC